MQVCAVTNIPLKPPIACVEFSSMYLEASSVIEQHMVGVHEMKLPEAQVVWFTKTYE